MSSENVKAIVSKHFSEPTYFAHLDPKIMTMAKPLIVGVDVVGARILRSQNPNIPLTPKEIADEVIESVKAGATIPHIHVRDESGAATEDPSLNKEVWDRVFDAVGDEIVTSNHIMENRLARGLDMFKGYIDPLVEWNPKYLQVAATVTTDFSEPTGPLAYNISDTELAILVEYLEAKGVKPEVQMYAPGSIDRIKHALLSKPNKIRRPIWINMHLGKHHSPPVRQDPWSHIQVITWFNEVKAELSGEDVALGIYVGGRNWLPLTVLAIMIGADVIRVGMEDSLYMYPHKDDIIASNAETVRKIIAICNELGRPVATQAETRRILGFGTSERQRASAAAD
ncbi:3-keto-5-aminohexanoate cleavage protein [Acidiphilium sp. AL]|uniref:3-keto-5-aminohexanoate cleavage protein n=1 Tax=Acidiphilium sp. AL TaxID=2871704 RepID=UPI0021CB4ED0|nr:3-keto-5-aminohexanoate cleavage protein [Acidiphilium sp. AL]MCU4161162.1 3-keto-5-aminohexanoate cleavage protein [Acidiphilium sp. AL]